MARSRSPEAHEKVIKAALTLFGERGIDATSMDAIAHASGVSKATIYKHWADKEALLMEVMLHAHGIGTEPEDPDTGDLARDLAAVLSRKPPAEFEQARSRMMPALIAYAAVHREFGNAWRHRVMEPPRQSLKRILRRAMGRGLLQQDLDLDLAIALLLGPALYQKIFADRLGRRAAKDIVPETAEAFCRAFAPRQTTALPPRISNK